MEIEVHSADQVDYSELHLFLSRNFTQRPKEGLIAFDQSLIDSPSNLDNKYRKTPRSSFIVSVRDKGKIVSVNGFLGMNSLFYNSNKPIFQSCDSATETAYRGKGLFTHCVSEFERFNKDSWLFGLPNQSSINGFLKMGWQKIGNLELSLLFLRRHLVFDSHQQMSVAFGKLPQRPEEWVDWRFTYSSERNYEWIRWPSNSDFFIICKKLYFAGMAISLVLLHGNTKDYPKVNFARLKELSQGAKMVLVAKDKELMSFYERTSLTLGRKFNPRPFVIVGKNLPSSISVSDFVFGDWDAI